MEVIDGKVFVNGDEVKEGSELVFEGDDDVAWVDDDDVQVFVKKRMRAPDGNAFAFRVGPGEVRERVRKFIDDDVHVDREIVRERVPAPMMKHRMLFLGDEDEDFEIEEFAGAFADAEVWEMEREASRLAREARRAEGDEREKLEKELEKKLEAIFERKMELREKHVERLEEMLEEARTRLEERRKAREEIIKRRLRELLGEEDVYEW